MQSFGIPEMGLGGGSELQGVGGPALAKATLHPVNTPRPS